jgi:hypothetical protein
MAEKWLARQMRQEKLKCRRPIAESLPKLHNRAQVPAPTPVRSEPDPGRPIRLTP